MRLLAIEYFNDFILPHLPRPGSAGNPELARERLLGVLSKLVLSRNHSTPYIQNQEAVQGGTGLPQTENDIASSYFDRDQEARYLRIESEVGAKYNFDFRKLRKVRQDQAYSERFIDFENASPAEPMYESRGSQHPTMTTSITHLGLYPFRRRSVQEWQKRCNLNLAEVVWEMKKANALSPADKNTRAYGSD